MPTVKLFTHDGDTLRELTAGEYAQHETDKTDAQKQETAANVKVAAQAAAKKSAQAKLAALGLTADEIAAL